MKLGLALAGGGSLGAYQVGVLKYLTEEGYLFDVVTGTSVGAINGALVCTNEFEKLKDLWLEISSEKIIVDGVDLNKELLTELNPENLFKALKVYTLTTKITPLKDLCKKYIDPEKIANCNCEFGTICVDFPKLSEHKINMKQLEHDHILPFIHASGACYPVFPIETIDNKKYIDGFYKNNLPIDYCFELGAEHVIAIDLAMFGTKPQNYHLTKLPNVTYIRPRIVMGSFMDFSQKAIRTNMIRGYNDAKKSFGELLGFAYTFNKSGDLTTFSKAFMRRILQKGDKKTKELIKLISDFAEKYDFSITTEEDYFLFALELFARKYQIDDIIIYNYEDLIEIIYEKIQNADTNKYISTLKTTKSTLFNIFNKISNKNDEAALKEEIEISKNILDVFEDIYNLYKENKAI